MMKVFIRRAIGNEQVVNVTETELQPRKDFVYEMLKGLDSISQPEGHTTEL